jgi:hypothetical protein
MKLFTIGCSFTEGQELENHRIECYTHSLAEKLNLEYFNFGACGASNDYIFRKVFELINTNALHNDDIIIIQWTHYNRKELPVIHKNKKWYHYLPNSFHAYQDKSIVRQGRNLLVQNEYINNDIATDMKEIEANNKKVLDDYIISFLQEEYQKNTTINYINALYTYLEYFGYNHLHFFGWDECIINSVYDNGVKFINKSFGGYTDTILNKHPNKEGHDKWAHILFEKLNEVYKKNLKNNII